MAYERGTFKVNSGIRDLHLPLALTKVHVRETFQEASRPSCAAGNAMPEI
jgi:hypothetical protein